MNCSPVPLWSESEVPDSSLAVRASSNEDDHPQNQQECGDHCDVGSDPTSSGRVDVVLRLQQALKRVMAKGSLILQHLVHGWSPDRSVEHRSMIGRRDVKTL